MSALTQSFIDKIVAKLVSHPDIYGAVFYISSDDNQIDIISSGGDFQNVRKYFIASINKIFISAILFKYKAENKIRFKDKLADYLNQDLIKGLHIFNGKDYSYDLTLEHLLSQTSGLPCFLLDKQHNGNIGMKELESGNDRSWNVFEVIDTIKMIKPKYPHGEKARYINTNHQLLNLVIEKVAGIKVSEVITELINELDLKDTYVYNSNSSNDFASIRFKSNIISLNNFLTSCENEIISTAKDQMTFIKAFFNGKIFPKKQIEESSVWRSIFFPFKYGVGIQKFSVPRILSPFSPLPELLGHNGSTGSVAYYAPRKGVYITGTTNQQSKSSAPYQPIIRMLMKIKDIK